MSYTLNVVQFLRPNAEKRLLTLDVSDETGKKWETEIEPLNLRLTAETIPGGLELEEQVCVCLEDLDLGDYRLILCPNIPDGPVAKEVEEMILAFDASDYLAWVESLTDDED